MNVLFHIFKNNNSRKTFTLTFTLRSIKCALIGGLDKRILQRLQVREFKDDWPLRPVGASRVTQVPQKCDLHSEHCFCKKLNKNNIQ